MTRKQHLICAATIVGVLTALSATAQRSTAHDPLVLSGVTIVDTYTGKLTPNMAVVIDGEKIVKILPTNSPLLHGHFQTVDARGKYVVPGFLDMHLHVFQEVYPQDTYALMLANGVTGWRQMSASPSLLQKRKDGHLGLGPNAPMLLAMPGTILTNDNAANPSQARAEVDKQKAEGADFIKTILLTPKSFFAALDEAKKQGLPFVGHLSPGVDPVKASELGMKSMEHLGPFEMEMIDCSKYEWLIHLLLDVYTPKQPDLSPEAMKTFGRLLVSDPLLGLLQVNPREFKTIKILLDSFVQSKCEDLAKTFVSHQTWQVPTLVRERTSEFADAPQYTNDPNLRYVPQEQKQYWQSIGLLFTQKVDADDKKIIQHSEELQLQMTKIYDQAGVPMLAGSDSGIWLIPGFSLHQEFDLLARAGLTPLKVLQMTTLNGAKFVNREATMGSVAEGKQADLVLLEGNPIESVHNFHAIYAVVRAGHYYSKDTLEAMKQKVADHVAKVGYVKEQQKDFAP